LLFCVTAGLALALAALVLAAPALDQDGKPADGWPRLVAVFARDAVVRRTAIAAAVGLLVTAFVFFRPPRLRWPGERDKRSPRSPSGNVVGA
jgi:hypothetical protein